MIPAHVHLGKDLMFARRGLQKFLRLLFLLPLLLAGSAIFTGCKRSAAEGGVSQRAGSAPVPVLASRVITRDVPSQLKAIGNVMPYSTVTVRSRIGGALDKVHFKEGQEVKKGDLLFTIDPRISQGILSVAQSGMVRDAALLAQSRIELDRTKKLFESALVSRDEFDKASAAWKTLLATLEADKAALANATLNVEFTSIRSPLDGRTGGLLVHEGNLVNAETDALVTINQVRPIQVAFSVPEQRLSEIRREMQGRALQVTAMPSDSDGPAARGELTFIDNTVDATTGMIQLRATFLNADNTLWPGQFVQAMITLKSIANAMVVPSQVIQTGQKGDYVFVIKNDQTVELRPVVTGLSYNDETVVTSGLKAGEPVILDGQLRLVPGAKVSVKPTGGFGTNATASAESP